MPSYGDTNSNPADPGITDFRLTFQGASNDIQAQILCVIFTVDVDSIKDLIGGYQIVRTKRDSSNKTIWGVGMINPMISKSGSDAGSSAMLPAGFASEFANFTWAGPTTQSRRYYKPYPSQESVETLNIDDDDGATNPNFGRFKTFDCFDFDVNLRPTWGSGDKILVRDRLISINYRDTGYRQWYAKSDGTTGNPVPANTENVDNGTAPPFVTITGSNNDNTHQPFFIMKMVNDPALAGYCDYTDFVTPNTNIEDYLLSATSYVDGNDTTTFSGGYTINNNGQDNPTGIVVATGNPCGGKRTLMLDIGANKDGSDLGLYTSNARYGCIAASSGDFLKLIALYYKPNNSLYGGATYANRTASNWMAAPHEAASSDLSAANNSENTQSQKIGGYLSAIGDITGMSKMRQMFSYGTGNDEKTTGFWGKYNDLTGITARNNQKASMQENQFAGGGMNMQPNAEVEKQENTLNPDGSTNQYDGASHEQGGIPTNLDAGTLIFSDKLKMGGKTFAKLNKPNMTHKEDKILANKDASAMSKLTADLMKQAKNKSSMELFEAQEALKQSKLDSYTKRLGGIMKYPNGGTIPLDKYKQAQTDSMTLYNAGLQSNKRPYYDYPGTTEAMQRLQDINSTKVRIVAPEAIQGEAYGNQPGYNGGYNVKFKKPTMLPYKDNQLPLDNNGVQRVENYVQPIGKPVQHPNYNQFIPGINQSKQPIQIEQFRKGGRKDPNDINALNSRQQTDYNSWFNANSSNDGFNPDEYSVDNYMKQYESRGATSPTINSLDTGNSGQGNKFDWKGLGTQAAYFAANNAGNLYDLARSRKVEDTKFQRATASLLDDSAALRDATEQTRRAEYNVRGASGGNAGTYLSNRVGLNTQNIMNKDRIRQQYANANAGISNQVNQVNTGIANQEYVANEQNRAASRNTKQGALAYMGSNTANQMNDVRNTNMDQKKLDGLIKLYPALAKDPKMLEYFMSFHK